VEEQGEEDDDMILILIALRQLGNSSA
jgi:hypothetical protein